MGEVETAEEVRAIVERSTPNVEWYQILREAQIALTFTFEGIFPDLPSLCDLLLRERAASQIQRRFARVCFHIYGGDKTRKGV